MLFSGQIQLRILTPSRIVFQTDSGFEGDAIAIRVPGSLAPFEVLPRHAPIISALDIGEVRISRGSAADPLHEYLAISGGVIEVRRDEVILLANAAEWANEIDVARAEAARDRARERLRRSASPDIDVARAQAALARALNRLRVAAHGHS